MSKLSEPVRARINKLLPLILKQQDESLLNYQYLADQIGGGTEKQIQYALRKAVPELKERNRTIVIGQHSATIRIENETEYDRRLQSAVEEKRAVGAALWNILFGLGLSNDLQIWRSWQDGEKKMGGDSAGDKTSGKILKKLHILTNRTNIGIGIDNGTSNVFAIDQFLETIPKVPFPIHSEGEDFDSRNFHLMSPIFVTNSIGIAEKIRKSEKRNGIGVRLIGGTIRTDRNSIVGELSLLWLRALHNEGKMVSLDLSIIGTTGYDTESFAVPTLCCTDADESALKSRLLGMGNFRCSVFESEKLTPYGSAGFTFAPVSGSSLDLIVTDNGSGFGCEKEVLEFAKTAHKNGVAVAIVSKSGGFPERTRHQDPTKTNRTRDQDWNI